MIESVGAPDDFKISLKNYLHSKKNNVSWTKLNEKYTWEFPTFGAK
jgi:hypothetical protein